MNVYTSDIYKDDEKYTANFFPLKIPMVGSDVFPIEIVLFLGDMLVFGGVNRALKKRR